MARTSARGLVLPAALIFVIGGGVWLAVRAFGGTDEFALAEQAVARRDFTSAREHLRKHLEDHPHDRAAMLLAARTARRDGDLPAAQKHLSDLRRAAGESDDTRLEADLIALQLGSSRESTRLLESCRRAPDAPATALILEALLATTLDVLAPPFAVHDPLPAAESDLPALRDARAAVELWFQRPLEPADELQGRIWRARVREVGGDHRGALDDLNRALELDPGHRQANFLAAVFRRQEEPHEACRRLLVLAEHHPEDANIAFACAIHLREAGRLAEARAMLDDLMKKEPGIVRIRLVRAQVALDLQHPQEAEPLLRSVIERTPAEGEAYAALSRCMRQLGREAEAAKYHEQYLTFLQRERSPRK